MTIQPSSTGSVRQRTRINTNAQTLQPGATADWMKSGASAIEEYQRNREQVSARREANDLKRQMPYRFSLKQGEEADIVILDADFGPVIYEHDLKNHPRFQQINSRTGYPKDLFVTSCWQFEPDPLKQFGLEPYMITFLTVIDMRAGMTRDNRPYSNVRKLLALKGDAMDMLSTIRQQRIAAGHTQAPLRGVQLLMRRSTDQRSLKTGLPMFVAHHDEATVMATFAHADVKDDQGKVIKAANTDCYPVDYAALFPKPTAEAICRQLNIDPPKTMGSAHGNADSWDAPSAPAGGGIQPSGGIRPSGGGIQPSSAQSMVPSQGEPGEDDWDQPGGDNPLGNDEIPL